MTKKQHYDSPVSEVVELSLEGCIAQSAPGFEDGGDLFD